MTNGPEREYSLRVNQAIGMVREQIRGTTPEAIALIDQALASRYSEDFCSAALIAGDHLRRSAPEPFPEPFRAKLVIWDLDDTL